MTKQQLSSLNECPVSAAPCSPSSVGAELSTTASENLSFWFNTAAVKSSVRIKLLVNLVDVAKPPSLQ